VRQFSVWQEEGGEENVKEEPELVVPDAAAAAAAGPLMSRAQEEAALQSVLGQLHAAQRERMLVMEREEMEKVRYPLVLNSVTGSGGSRGIRTTSLRLRIRILLWMRILLWILILLWIRFLL
jgi:hypothetical protein